LSLQAKQYTNKKKLFDLFSYAPDTGYLYWKKKINPAIKLGVPIGINNKSKYCTVRIYKQDCYVHRIVYKMFIGRLHIDKQVDHLDGNTKNNRLNNLELKTHAENSKNRRLISSNTSGFTGVGWCKNMRKWRAYIHQVDGKMLIIGYSKDILKAAKLRANSLKKYGYSKHHGEIL